MKKIIINKDSMNVTNERLIWLNGVITKLSEAKINVLSPTSQFGANVFEGIRCYWNEEKQQLYAFRLKEHYDRLLRSIKIVRLEEKYTVSDFFQGLKEIIIANNYREDIAVRQTVFVDGFGTWSSTGPVGMFIAPIPKGRTCSGSKAGLRCCISSWERISDRTLSPRAKVGANYMNSRMAQLQALECGFDTAILLNSQGKVAEGPGSCFFMVRDGVLITPPCTASVLESITRDTIITLAREILHIPTLEREIDRTELYISEEAFLCGSAMEITPVLNVDGYLIHESVPGEITKKLQSTYLDVVSGNTTVHADWLTPIY